MADERKLRIQQEMFCINYVTDFNATQAAIDAGYSKDSAAEQASRLLTNVNVQHKISELVAHKIKAVNVTSQRVVSELHEIAFSDFREAYKDDGSIKDVKDMPDALRKAIASIEVEELWDGKGEDRRQIGVTKKIKFWPKDKALDQLGRYLKMFTDRMEHTGSLRLEDMVDASWKNNKSDSDSSST